jgi:hypothetical protein
MSPQPCCATICQRRSPTLLELLQRIHTQAEFFTKCGSKASSQVSPEEEAAFLRVGISGPDGLVSFWTVFG